MPAAIPPGVDIIATLIFTPASEEFMQHATIYVEERTGIRPLEITVKSASREPPS